MCLKRQCAHAMRVSSTRCDVLHRKSMPSLNPNNKAVTIFLYIQLSFYYSFSCGTKFSNIENRTHGLISTKPKNLENSNSISYSLYILCYFPCNPSFKIKNTTQCSISNTFRVLKATLRIWTFIIVILIMSFPLSFGFSIAETSLFNIVFPFPSSFLHKGYIICCPYFWHYQLHFH